MKYEPAVVPLLIEQGLNRNKLGIAAVVKRNGRWIETPVEEFKRKVRHLGLGLYQLGVRRGDRVSIHSENSTEWLICDQAVLSIGAINVAIYTMQPADQIHYILSDSESKVYFFSNDEIYASAREEIKKVASLKAIISVQPSIHEEVTSWNKVLALGEKLDKEQPGLFEEVRGAIQPDDLANINYTSGTTGVPKGVMLTHMNLASNTIASSSRVPFNAQKIDVPKVLSYLPLAHMLERIVSYLVLYVGATMYFVEDIQEFRSDLVTVKPIYFATVPRLLEKIYTGLKTRGQELSGLQKQLYYWALHLAEKYDPEHPPRGMDALRWHLADRLVYRKIREGMGGKVIGMMTGGAALAPNIMRFFNGIGFKCGMGYGLTETSPVMTASLPNQIRIGSAGKALEDVEIEIAEDGEILTKGPNLMKGYYKMPEKTAEVMTDNGWFRTGDIGYLDDDGWLFITDRKKSMFKLSTGKYVAPQPIENALINSGFIDQALVIGSQEKFCAALIVPDWANLEKRFSQKGIPYPKTNRASNPEVMNIIQREVDKVNMKLPYWEKVKKFTLIEEPFSIEKGELTPKLSVRRSVVKEHYKQEITQMYKE